MLATARLKAVGSLLGRTQKDLLMGELVGKTSSKPKSQFAHLIQQKGDDNLRICPAQLCQALVGSSEAPSDTELFSVYATEDVDKR